MQRTLISLGTVFALFLGTMACADEPKPAAPATPLADTVLNPVQDKEPALPTRAVAIITGTKGYEDVKGMIWFTQADKGVRVTGEVSGLTEGKHGFHIHEFGDLSDLEGKSAGGHFNPYNTKHGGPDDEEHHYGDLGNIVAGEDGVAKIDMKAEWMEVHFILGRGLVVHAGADDLVTQPTGDAGARAGVGVIAVAAPAPAE